MYEQVYNESRGKSEVQVTGSRMKTEKETGYEPSLLIEMERQPNREYRGRDGEKQVAAHRDRGQGSGRSPGRERVCRPDLRVVPPALRLPEHRRDAPPRRIRPAIRNVCSTRRTTQLSGSGRCRRPSRRSATPSSSPTSRPARRPARSARSSCSPSISGATPGRTSRRCAWRTCRSGWSRCGKRSAKAKRPRRTCRILQPRMRSKNRTPTRGTDAVLPGPVQEAWAQWQQWVRGCRTVDALADLHSHFESTYDADHPTRKAIATHVDTEIRRRREDLNASE